jgi:hypothetical protein
VLEALHLDVNAAGRGFVFGVKCDDLDVIEKRFSGTATANHQQRRA